MADTAAASKLYGSRFFQDQVQDSLRSARSAIPVVLGLVRPRSLVDVGCGVGTWLSVVLEEGVDDVLGIDGSYVDRHALLIPAERFLAHDLASPLNLGRRFDLAMSLEVAEHLPRDRSEAFVELLTRLSDLVLFSAAIPGQGGTGHINERWQSFWRDLFMARHYTPVDILRRQLWNEQGIEAYYRQNMILYASEDELGRREDLRQAIESSRCCPFDLVHPLCFESVLGRPLNLRRLLRSLPGAIRESIQWHFTPR
jgi:hypothetical protein